MLKFKDSDGKVIGELSDDASEPEFYMEDKKKKKAKKNLGVNEKSVMLQTDPNYVASGKGTK